MLNQIENIATCLQCGNNFSTKNRKKNRIHKYCSLKCAHKDQARTRKGTHYNYPKKRAPQKYKKTKVCFFCKLDFTPMGSRSWVCQKQECREKYNRSYMTMKRYNLSWEQYEELRIKHDGHCGICGTDDPKGRYGVLHVDHDHISGKVRGLICYRCNTILGLVKENVGLLKMLIEYLQRNEVESDIVMPSVIR